eukprot:CAMPEP_0170271016 /NCGR_PEP_ID=MMETSP0116_2-20130129/35457_1 /TAXON_ID=400756 /ORGANISM="Durinskia baltica, Strain CSIRO CS-38" /LENGTH=110 /DNA_ID=CAMNT_0010522217 /DNA_START=160 /DNA_END=492 /DNA_ORIENTATION=-
MDEAPAREDAFAAEPARDSHVRRARVFMRGRPNLAMAFSLDASGAILSNSFIATSHKYDSAWHAVVTSGQVHLSGFVTHSTVDGAGRASGTGRPTCPESRMGKAPSEGKP